MTTAATTARTPRRDAAARPTTAGEPSATRRWPLLGGLLAATAVVSSVGVVILTSTFDWPAVLGEPAAVGLPAFDADRSVVALAFYLLLVGSVLLVPVALGVEAALTRATAAVRVFTVFGVAGALVQILGWVRWPLVVPGLADRYLDPAADETTRAAVGASYDVLNAYAGGALGEHLGWLLQAVWALAVGVWALRAVGVPRWVGLVGLVSAVVWAPLLVAEPFVPGLGTDAASGVAFTAYSVWFVWLAVLGAVVALRRVGPRPQMAAGA